MDGWLVGWMLNERMVGWMDVKWMVGWLDGC